MDNKHRKLFVIKQSKGCKFIPKKLRPDPLGELIRSHRSLVPNDAYFKGRKRRGGEEAYF